MRVGGVGAPVRRRCRHWVHSPRPARRVRRRPRRCAGGVQGRIERAALREWCTASPPTAMIAVTPPAAVPPWEGEGAVGVAVCGHPPPSRTVGVSGVPTAAAALTLPTATAVGLAALTAAAAALREAVRRPRRLAHAQGRPQQPGRQPRHPSCHCHPPWLLVAAGAPPTGLWRRPCRRGSRLPPRPTPSRVAAWTAGSRPWARPTTRRAAPPRRRAHPLLVAASRRRWGWSPPISSVVCRSAPPPPLVPTWMAVGAAAAAARRPCYCRRRRCWRRRCWTTRRRRRRRRQRPPPPPPPPPPRRRVSRAMATAAGALLAGAWTLLPPPLRRPPPPPPLPPARRRPCPLSTRRRSTGRLASFAQRSSAWATASTTSPSPPTPTRRRRRRRGLG